MSFYFMLHKQYCFVFEIQIYIIFCDSEDSLERNVVNSFKVFMDMLWF